MARKKPRMNRSDREIQYYSRSVIYSQALERISISVDGDIRWNLDTTRTLDRDPVKLIERDGRYYVRTTIDGQVREMSAGALAWYSHYQDLPKGDILYMDGDRTNVAKWNMYTFKDGLSYANRSLQKWIKRKIADSNDLPYEPITEPQNPDHMDDPSLVDYMLWNEWRCELKRREAQKS